MSALLCNATLPCNFAGALYPKVCLRLVQCTGHVQADAFNEASNLGLFALFGFRFLFQLFQPARPNIFITL